MTSTGEAQFAEIPPEPTTTGKYGTDGTVGEYLQSQETAVFEEFADRYFQYFSQLAASAARENSSLQLLGQLFLEHVPLQHRLLLNKELAPAVASLFDIDHFLAVQSPESSTTDGATAEAKAEAQLAILKRNP